MTTEWIKNFIVSFERLIEKPPYLIFVFIGTIFVIVSLISQFSYKQTWAFLVYAVCGTIWRYAEKDLTNPLIKKYPDSKLWIRAIYHIGNLALLIVFLHYLNFI